VQNTSPRNVLDHAVATIPSDRHRWGLVLPMMVAENTVLERHNEDLFGKGIMLDYDKLHSYTSELIKRYDIRPAGCEQERMSGLSGGNQQKAIIAREVSYVPDVLIAFQPTRGLDVGAIEFVHKTLIAERDRGAAILLVSYELDEVMDVSDTIAVIYHGQIVGTFAQGTVDEEQLGLLMAGGGSQ
jgi:simple sugar transport system ATP-binding protein